MLEASDGCVMGINVCGLGFCSRCDVGIIKEIWINKRSYFQMYLQRVFFVDKSRQFWRSVFATKTQNNNLYAHFKPIFSDRLSKKRVYIKLST